MAQGIMYNLQHRSPGTCGHCEMTSVFTAAATSVTPLPWVHLLLLLSSEPSHQAARLPRCHQLSLFLSNFTQCCVTMATMGQQFAEFH